MSPVYEYQCIKKKHRWESYYSVENVRQGLDDPDKLECPVCGSKVRKLISVAVTRVGKSRWYNLDDTDELTLEKCAVDKKIPDEFNRVIKENKKKQKEFLKKDKEYKKRLHIIKKAKEPIEVR